MKKLLPNLALVFLIIISSCNKEEINELEKRNQELTAQTSQLQGQINNLTTEINTLILDVSNLS